VSSLGRLKVTVNVLVSVVPVATQKQVEETAADATFSKAMRNLALLCRVCEELVAFTA